MGERKSVDAEMGGGQKEVLRLTPDMMETIKFIIGRLESAEKATTDAKEDIKGLAEKMGCKPGKVSKMIGIIRRERDKGGIIIAETEVLNLADQALTEGGLAVKKDDEKTEE